VRLDVPTLAIAEAARDHSAALVVMATHGRSVPGRLVMGSIADAVLKHSRVPLLLVRPRRLGGGDAKAAQSANAAQAKG
jgi:nucleotide-binding universal stress UspA family protein